MTTRARQIELHREFLAWAHRAADVEIVDVYRHDLDAISEDALDLAFAIVDKARPLALQELYEPDADIGGLAQAAIDAVTADLVRLEHGDDRTPLRRPAPTGAEMSALIHRDLDHGGAREHGPTQLVGQGSAVALLPPRTRSRERRDAGGSSRGSPGGDDSDSDPEPPPPSEGGGE
jgi:hypothetical protein